jgi:sulfate adenylyltransferase subunit 1
VRVNSINEMAIKSASPLFLDNFNANKNNGYFVLIDEQTNATVGVGFKVQ